MFVTSMLMIVGTDRVAISRGIGVAVIFSYCVIFAFSVIISYT